VESEGTASVKPDPADKVSNRDMSAMANRYSGVLVVVSAPLAMVVEGNVWHPEAVTSNGLLAARPETSCPRTPMNVADGMVTVTVVVPLFTSLAYQICCGHPLQLTGPMADVHTFPKESLIVAVAVP